MKVFNAWFHFIFGVCVLTLGLAFILLLTPIVYLYNGFQIDKNDPEVTVYNETIGQYLKSLWAEWKWLNVLLKLHKGNLS